MKLCEIDYKWINHNLEKFETPEQKKRRKFAEASSQIVLTHQYYELKGIMDQCQKFVDEIYVTDNARKQEIHDLKQEPKVKTFSRKKRWIEEISFKSRIDTLEIKDYIDNRKNHEVIIVKGTQSRRSTHDPNVIITKYNPNNCMSEYSDRYVLSETLEKLQQIHEQLEVKDTSKIAITRVDIATDIDKNFKEISKFLDLTHKCIRAEDKYGYAWSNQDEESLYDSNFIYRNRHKFEIEFYDKEMESNGRAPLPTRMELRF